MTLRMGLVIAIALVLIWVIIFWLAGRKHFCKSCEIAYVYSLKAFKKTHCDVCGAPLTKLFEESDEGEEDGDKGYE